MKATYQDFLEAVEILPPDGGRQIVLASGEPVWFNMARNGHETARGTAVCLSGLACVMRGLPPRMLTKSDMEAHDPRLAAVRKIFPMIGLANSQVRLMVEAIGPDGRFDLRGADLSGASMRDADLRGADLSRANLRGAVLSRANLRGAVLRDADLHGAVLRDAVLRGADLRGVDLSWVVL